MAHNRWLLVAAALAGAPCAANAQALVSERSIAVDAALDMARASLDACRKHGSVVSITVLDRAAPCPQWLLRSGLVRLRK